LRWPTASFVVGSALAGAPTGTDGTDQLWAAMITPYNGGAPFLMKEPKLPLGYTWNWNGLKLLVGYTGGDATATADAPTW
jgi:hypothetical protein